MYILLALLVVGLWACGPDPEPADTATPATPVVAPQQLQTAPQTEGAVALNPAHGQPGHRCDIAVGAPLNSPAGAQQAPQIDMSKMSNGVIQPGAATAPAAPVNTDNTTTANVNPPHGQPGHRCDIAVGAPLN